MGLLIYDHLLSPEYSSILRKQLHLLIKQWKSLEDASKCFLSKTCITGLFS